VEDLYLDDFAAGDSFPSAAATVTESQIISFALDFDPQPFHMDAEAAAKSSFGGLVASGFHTLALTFRLFFQTGALAACNIAGPGLDEVRWLRPVRPGDTLHTVAEVTEVRRSRSKPDRGSVRMIHRTYNQRGEEVMTVTVAHIVRRRPAAGAAQTG